jgi:hypothetical protein
MSRRNNPVTMAGYHLRPGLKVLWESDDGNYVLAVVAAADSTAARQRARVPTPQALLHFPNGAQVLTPINRVHALPLHGPYRRGRRARR